MLLDQGGKRRHCFAKRLLEAGNNGPGGRGQYYRRQGGSGLFIFRRGSHLKTRVLRNSARLRRVRRGSPLCARSRAAYYSSSSPVGHRQRRVFHHRGLSLVLIAPSPMLSSLVSFPTASFFFRAVSSSGAWNSKCTASSLKKKGLSRSLGTVRLSSNTVIKKYTGVFVPRLERESLREEGAENK